MKHRSGDAVWHARRTWLALALILTLAGAARGATDGTPGPTLDEFVAGLPHSDVSGAVLADGKPAPGVEVFVYYEASLDGGFRNRLAGRTVTDAAGRFTLKKAIVWEPPQDTMSQSDVPKYDIIARDPKLGIGFEALLEGDRTEGIKIELNKPTWDDVSVADTAGKPLEGVKVFLSGGYLKKRRDAGQKWEYCAFSLNTDIGLSLGVTGKDGKVRLMGFPNASYNGMKDGYVKGWNKKMVLRPGAQVAGRLTDPAGKPVPGAAVFYQYRGVNTSAGEVAMTDAEGRYELKRLHCPGFSYNDKPAPEDKAGGQMTLHAVDLRRGSELACKPLKLKLKAGDKQAHDIQMVQGRVLAGKVVDETTGRPVTRMTLARSTEKDDGYLETFHTDDQGRFRLVYTPGRRVMLYWDNSDGDYILDEDQANHRSYEGVMDTSHTDVVLKARLWQVCTLKGTVLGIDGKPLKNARVQFNSDVPECVTGGKGDFTLKTAPKDLDYDLYASDAAGKTAALAHLRAGTTSVTLRLQPTRPYQGKVAAQDGIAADGLKFYLDLLINDSSLYRVRTEPVTGADGTFTAPNLLPGAKYYAWWRSDHEKNRDYDYGGEFIDLAALKPGEPIRFTAKHFVNTIMGKVVDPAGEPVAGAQIKIASSMLAPMELRANDAIKTDKNGAFTITRLAAGMAALRVSHPGFTTRVIQTPSDNIECEIKLAPKGSAAPCRIEVVDASDMPVKGAPLQVRTFYLAEKTNAVTSQTETLTTDAAGRAEWAPRGDDAGNEGALIQGFVCCDQPDRDLAVGSFQPGEATDLRLTLKQGGAHWSGRVFDAAHRPVAGARITVTDAQSATSSDWIPLAESAATCTTSGPDGTFKLTRFSRECGLTLRASAGGVTQDCIQLNPEEVRQQDIKLTKGGTIAGRVITPSGRPMSHGSVYLESTASRGKSARVQCDGSFSASGLPTGIYTARFFSPAPEDERYVLFPYPKAETSEGRQAVLTITMREGVAVKGRLIDTTTGKAPTGRVLIDCSLKNGERYGGGAQMQPDGSWSMHLIPGTYGIRYYINSGSLLPSDETLTIEAGKTYDNVTLKYNAEGEGGGK